MEVASERIDAKTEIGKKTNREKGTKRTEMEFDQKAIVTEIFLRFPILEYANLEQSAWFDCKMTRPTGLLLCVNL